MTWKARHEMTIVMQAIRNHNQSKIEALNHITAGVMPDAFWSNLALDTRSCEKYFNFKYIEFV